MTDTQSELRVRELRHLLSAIRIAIRQGAGFLVSRCAPNGPIMSEYNLSYICKACWGLYAASCSESW